MRFYGQDEGEVNIYKHVNWKKNEAMIQPSLVQVLQELKNLSPLTLGVLGAHCEKTK